MSDPDSGDDLDSDAQLQPEDTLEYGGVTDVLDEGYSPPERPWNDRDDETLDERLADEEPDTWAAELDATADAEGRDDARAAGVVGDPDSREDFSDVDDATGDLLGDAPGTDGELLADDEVGDRRAGRLTIDDASVDGSDGGEKELVAGDAGIDGAGASAEEAAVHVVDEP
ncbi:MULTISPECIES: DUF5709 domain-containing protein [Pseudonocardia]|uniref:DUF5709 domain-containing protein n=1 Tax=Pseudonocardia alni TaxID=33907 RepID=A0AA44UUG8_PSEA5|nr:MULTISPECIES: DUF5709 domain-containing protein [Pseudonocardia]MYW72152.1 hypothetical protein [Pseudonocardia sp. SID8383]OJG05241.1 hypothetical protein BG618_03818 [Pseudonocardia autotrophica]PKB33626.1 hypothetical protein ATL51_5392 [Pseudonocardia alni]